jgi:hypothetical protein
MSTTPDKAVAPEKKIPCEECEKEVPLSEAITSEAEDYVLYFCGVECFERWRKKAQQKFSDALPDSKK